MQLTPIAYARNGFTDKFGIPRQSRPDSALLTRIVFEPAFRDPNMLRGLEGYSHLWLIWGFDTDTWSPTVRPPRLGGNTRMGVFATRSPFRPNPLGLTSVQLVKILDTPEGKELLVRGADLLNGTPVYDIKPYLSFSDSHPEAQNGFAEAHREERLDIDESECSMPDIVPAATMRAVREILEQDPRPHYQHDPNRRYKMDYEDWKIEFYVIEHTLHLISILKHEK